MRRKMIVSILVLGTMAVAVAVGAVAYRSVSAKTSASAVASLSASKDIGLVASDFDQGYGKGDGQNDEYLAQALGITTDELNAAVQKAQEAALAQAVEKGLITQGQADQLKSNGSAFPFGGRWSGWFDQNDIDFEALLADALGISVDQLEAARLQANNARIDQAVTDGRLTQEQADLAKGWYALRSNDAYQTAIQSAFEAAVKQAVTDGVITQAQADLILQQAAEKGAGGFPGLDGLGRMDGPGGGHGRGQHGLPGANPGQTAPQPTTP